MEGVDVILRHAAACHGRGELVEAESLYRRALAVAPARPGVLHLLGVLLGQAGRSAESIAMLGDAIAAAPAVAMYRNDLGNAFREAGQLGDAIAAFRSAVALDPAHVAAVANLGNALGDAGQFEEAVTACEQAARLAPLVATVHSELGVALVQVGRIQDGLTAHERAIAIDPNNSRLLNNYALALRSADRATDAEAACRRALLIDPQSTEAMNNLAVLRLDADDPAAAVTLLVEAIRLRPEYAEAHNNLGNALCATGEAALGEAEVRLALQIRPRFADAQNNLATALRDQGRHHDALVASDTSLAINPRSSAAHTNRGTCLADDARFEEAAAAYERAIAVDPKSVAAHTNLAAAWVALGMKDRGLAAARQAVVLAPSNAAVRTNLGLMLLTHGEFAEGWRENEWRWKANPKSRVRGFTQPQWDGADLNGRTILLHAEQGFGDGIQFMRYAPLVAGRGGRVLLEVAPELHRLARTVAGVAQVISYGQPLPPFDLHCPLMSIPFATGTTLVTVPAAVPYVHAPAELQQCYADRLSSLAGQRFGLVWAGRPSHSNDRNRSMKFDRLAPLFNLPGIAWVSLQQRPASEALRRSGWRDEVLDLGDELHDFADTAAVLANLDGLVSVDSAVAHLAGAMGVPTWLLLPRVADWRWMTERGDSPWYPQHRLVRQRVNGRWEDGVAEVAEALRGDASR